MGACVCVEGRVNRCFIADKKTDENIKSAFHESTTTPMHLVLVHFNTLCSNSIDNKISIYIYGQCFTLFLPDLYTFTFVIFHTLLMINKVLSNLNGIIKKKTIKTEKKSTHSAGLRWVTVLPNLSSAVAVV